MTRRTETAPPNDRESSATEPTWPPHLVVATLVEREGRFLCVEERVNGRQVINQPAGHWDPGESVFEAALRETLEESAWHVELTALLGIYSYAPIELDYGFLRFAFLARPLRHDAHRTLDSDIERALWLTPDELAESQERHRSPMVLRCVEDALAGQSYPLDMIRMLNAFQ